MRLKAASLIGGVLSTCLLGALPLQAQDLSLYAEPPEGWAYTFAGDQAASADDESLDGTWSHNNGSDSWDGSAIGEGAPGGVSALTDNGEAFVRMQEPGDPRDYDMPDPSNRKVSFHRDLRADGVNADKGGNFAEGFKPLRDGVTLNFRARLPTPAAGGPLDQRHPDGGNAPEDWPAEGDGGTIHDSGKGMFGIHEADTDDPAVDKSGKISFSLGLTTDEQEGAPEMNGLIMNSKSGPDVSGDVEAGQGVQQNLVAIDDLTEWHEFWITIVRDESDEEATHKVTVYVDGSVEGQTFFVTAGTGQDNESDYLWLSLGSTPQSAAVDIDFYRVAQGINEPSQPSDPNVVVSRSSGLGQVPTVPSTHEGSITIRSTGETKTLNLSNIAVSGPDADHWTVGASPDALAPGETGTLAYTFNSLGETGAFHATLSFDTDDPDSPSVNIALSASVINAAGPGGHYPLDDSENADQVIVDITGYGRPGRYVAGDGAVTFGQAGLAGGTAAAISGGGSLAVPASKFGDITDYTATFWMNLTGLPEVLGAVVSRAAVTDANPATSLLVTPDGGFWWLAPDVSEEPLITIDPIISTGTPYHVALVAQDDHDKVSIYVDGVLVGSGESLGAANPSEPGDFFFGAFGPLASTGVFDDLQIYTRALESSDITFLAANPGAVIEAEQPDSDNDGLTDAEEAALGTNPVEADTDGDGLTDFAEVREHLTNPLLADTDEDGLDDGVEVNRGTDPLDASDPKGGALLLEIVETGLGGDTPAIFDVLEAFGEDALTFSDRTHQHNGAAFDSGSGQLSTGGDLVIELPSYLVGRPYVRFANDARDQAGYSATVTASAPVQWYLLLDNRINGPAGDASSPNSTDPELGGTFQWVIDGGWERVKTGLSPDDQADYTGVDEGGDDSLNQFYSVYTLTEASTEVTVSNNGTGGSNMISLVAGAAAAGGPLEGLLGYWRLNGDAADVSGQGHDGTVISPDNAWIDDPQRGQVYQSGGGSYIEFGEILPVLDLDSDFTWSFWVNADETDNNNIVFGNRWASDGADFAPREFIKFTPRVFEWHVDAAGQNIPGDNTMFVVGEWAHNLVVKEGSALTYYRNGQVVGSNEITAAPINPQPLYLGGQNGSENFSGRFDEVAIFDRALSSEEVEDVYQRGLNGQSLGGGDGPDPVDPGGSRVVLENVGITASGVFGVTIPDGLSVTIEYSADLETWSVIATDLSGAVEETDAGRIAAPQGYYRAILP